MSEKLTASDIQKIEEEIEYRKMTLRPKFLEDLKEARAQGDLSENFEYYAAKKDKNFALADAIREELLEKGVVLKDTREGTTWEMK